MWRAWDKEKIWVPDGIWTYDHPNAGRGGGGERSIHLSYGELMKSEALYYSYLTRVLHTARIRKGRCRTVRWWAWDKEKIWVPDGIWTYDHPNAGGRGGGALYPLELRRTHEERGPILGSYLTRVLHTARISKVDVVLWGDDARIHALVPFATSSILALKDNFVI